MTNQHDEQSPEQALHERLCAYVLGEGTTAERAEIERELLRSPELRAQRDTLERTIGLVKESLGQDETLSHAAAQTVYSAAASSKASAWQAVPWMRLAAGLGAVALGAVILREATRNVAYEVARVDPATRAYDSRRVPETAMPAEADKQDAARQPQAETAVAARKTSALDVPVGANAAPPAEGKAGEPVGAFDGFVSGGSASAHGGKARDQGESFAARARSLGYAGVRDQAGDLNIRSESGDRLSGGVAPAPTAPVPSPAAPDQSVMRLDARPATPLTKTEAVVGVEFKKNKEAAALSAGLEAPAASTGGPASSGPGGNYRGAGDSTPPVTMERKRAEESKDLAAGRWTVAEKQLGLLTLYDEARDDEALDRDERIAWYELSPADQQAYLDRKCRRILEGCYRRPNEKPRDMFFRFWGDNPFEVAALDSLSTFAADVDTASYTLARRYLEEGNVPEKAQIRTEEFVNYFKSDVPAPTNGVFGIHTNLTASRFSADTTRQMLRVVVRGKDLSKVERPRMNLTFVVDVSGSMRRENRLEMVKHAMRMLTTQLDPYDKIGIVKFSTDASVVLPLTNVSERAKIEEAIYPLAPEGSTNSNAGLELGYAIALGGLDPEATNRVVFLSDGVANVGEKDPAKIAERVKPMREKGIYLNTIGVGMGNHNDVLLEQLADKADGMCTYIDSPDEARKQLVDNFSGAFQPIARDVKIQVEFDPQQVLRYRLLGYENRAIADADFRNDKVDAGELGAGHQVTALYEVERQGEAVNEKPLATVRVRWKEPRNFGLNAESDKASEIEQSVWGNQIATFEGAGQSYRKVVLAAQFAEILRRSIHARGDSLDDLLNEALKLQKELPADSEFNEFVLLVSKSKDLILRTVPACDELCQAIDSVRENQYLRAQVERLQGERDQKLIEDLKRQNDELEAKLRDLVRRRLENQHR